MLIKEDFLDITERVGMLSKIVDKSPKLHLEVILFKIRGN
jgi:hypothetical protein